MISKNVFFCLITFMVRINCEDTVEPTTLKSIASKKEDPIMKFCSYLNPIIRVYAAEEVLNHQLVMIVTIQLQSQNKEPKKRYVIRSLYIQVVYPDDPSTHVFQARRWLQMEKIVRQKPIDLMFTSLDYKTMTFDNQSQPQLLYITYVRISSFIVFI